MRQIKRELKDAIQAANENQELQKMLQRAYVNQKIDETKYHPGDQVFLRQEIHSSGQSNKLLSPWAGPYLVTSCDENNNTVTIDVMGKSLRVNIDRLSPHLPREQRHSLQPQDYVGRYLLKEFPGHGVFSGKIVEFRETTDNTVLYKIKYSDGDEEELSADELEKQLSRSAKLERRVPIIDRPPDENVNAVSPIMNKLAIVTTNTPSVWYLAEVKSPKDDRDRVEVHYYRSYQRAVHPTLRQYFKAWTDPVDDKSVFTNRPKQHFEPELGRVDVNDIIASGFALVKHKLPHSVVMRLRRLKA